ncbi:zinc transporter, ZIP family [Fodinibius roseus]|uniref:Zinc transporter, ZIP family n=1 Tax=Fodinibius roseus TaxID=1194090 RepID=A0A1M5BZF3_9BACT|nr:ZIP family metal transporter [Fodinibius roseus]SHF47811.1 zinc transporter, ZIP family [Fodinibius roseus]
MSDKSIVYTSLFLFCLLTFLAILQSNWKIIGISWIAFGAMALAIPMGIQAAGQRKLNYLIAGYGLASGAMITSAAIFLVPTAINHHPVYGGLGIAAGIIAGFAIHTLNHGLTHTRTSIDPVVLELTSHALSAGLIIGMVYAAMPELGVLLGIAIVSHKGPAGYAASRRLTIQGKSALPVLLPAAAIGLTALPVSLLNLPGHHIINALIFGFATGVFFHVAIDFLPECEVGGKIHQETDLEHDEHHKLDQYRRRAVLYTFLGGLIVFLAWYAAY